MKLPDVLKPDEEPRMHTPVKSGQNLTGVSELLAVTDERTVRIRGDSYLSIPHDAIEYAMFKRHPEERTHEGWGVLIGILGGFLAVSGLVLLPTEGGVGGAMVGLGLACFGFAAHLYSLTSEYHESLTIHTSKKEFTVTSSEEDDLNTVCSLLTEVADDE